MIGVILGNRRSDFRNERFLVMFFIEEFVNILFMFRLVYVYKDLLLILCDWGCIREFSGIKNLVIFLDYCYRVWWFYFGVSIMF